MEEVEIKNVGGPRPRDGVASEATLASLLEVIRTNGRSTGTSTARAETRAIESFTRATRESTQSQGALAKAVAATETAMDLFQNALKNNTMRLSEFTENLIGNGNLIFRTLNRFNYFIDENIDRWRGLSQVGASFGNSLNELITTAVDGRMTLDEFSQMVLSNSEVLRSLSGTVTEGSKRFASLSRQLRASDIGRELYNIGFTFEEINETLLNYIDISRRSVNNQRLSNRQLMEGTAAYVDELERLTKITGMSRREAQQAMAQQLQDQRIRMRLAQMDPQEAARFQSNMAYLDNQVSGMGEVFRQLASMDPGDELSRLLQVFAPELARGARNIQNMTTSELHNFVATFGDQIDSVAANMGEQQVAYLYRTNSVFREMFNLASQANRLSVLTADEQQRLDRELESRSELTSLFANFEEQLRQIVGDIIGTFYDVAGETGGLNDALGNLASAFRRLISPHAEGSVTSLTGTFSDLIRTVFGPSGSIVDGIRRFTAFLDRPETRERFDRFIEGIRNFTTGLVDFLFGVQQDGAETAERTGGLFSRLYAMFISIVDSDRTFTDMLIDSFKGIFRTIGEEIVSYFSMSQDEGQGPWSAIYEHVTTQLLGWVEGNEAPTDNSDLWNRLTTAVGNRLLEVFDIERARLDNGNTESFWSAIFRSLNEKLFGYMEEIETPAGTVEVRRSGLIDTIIESINNMFADEGLVNSMITALTGLFNTVGSAFTDFWNGDTGQEIKTAIINLFTELVDVIERQVRSIIPGGGTTDIGAERIIERIRAGEDVSQEERDQLLTWLRSQSRSLSIEQGNWLERNLTRAGRYTGLFALNDIFEDAMDYGGSFSNEDFIEAYNQLDALRAEAEENSHKDGTVGFKDFGRESYAKLHGYEAVVPRDTLQGDLLSQFYAYQTSQQVPLFNTDFIKNLFSSMSSELSNLILNSTNMILTGAAEYNSIFNKKIDSLIEKNSLIHTDVQLLESKFSNLINIILERLSSVESSLASSIKETASSTATLISDKLAELEQKFSNALNLILEKFISISEKFVEMHADITTKFDLLEQKITNLVSSIIDLLVNPPKDNETKSPFIEDLTKKVTDSVSKYSNMDQFNTLDTLGNMSVDIKDYNVNPAIGGFSNIDKTVSSLNKKPDADVSKEAMNGLIEKIIDLKIDKPEPTPEVLPLREDNTQTELIKKIEELNKTMLQVVSLMTEELQVQKKTLRGVHGMGGDLMKGIAR